MCGDLRDLSQTESTSGPSRDQLSVTENSDDLLIILVDLLSVRLQRGIWDFSNTFKIVVKPTSVKSPVNFSFMLKFEM